MRRLLPSVIERGLGPTADEDNPAGELRRRHLEAIGAILATASPTTEDWTARDSTTGAATDALTLQLYWTLYVGVLSHWSEDTSPKQEDTLALLDASINMFTTWLESR